MLLLSFIVFISFSLFSFCYSLSLPPALAAISLSISVLILPALFRLSLSLRLSLSSTFILPVSLTPVFSLSHAHHSCQPHLHSHGTDACFVLASWLNKTSQTLTDVFLTELVVS